jgi:hypothetical protein
MTGASQYRAWHGWRLVRVGWDGDLARPAHLDRSSKRVHGDAFVSTMRSSKPATLRAAPARPTKLVSAAGKLCPPPAAPAAADTPRPYHNRRPRPPYSPAGRADGLCLAKMICSVHRGHACEVAASLGAGVDQRGDGRVVA